MKILFVASECAPFAKTGGLGDVAGALPIALKEHGHDVRVVLPHYDVARVKAWTRLPISLGVPMPAGEVWCGVNETRLPHSDVPVYLLDHGALYGRGYLYDPPGGSDGDNLSRFAVLSRGALQLCRALDWYPDVFHVHDWPSALVPAYLNTVERDSRLGAAATVLTLHNVAYQGVFGGDQFRWTGLPAALFRPDGFEDLGRVNLLKGGLYHATRLTAVSPTYASEIRSPGGGFGLDPVMRFRGADLVGILNGIDEVVWDPAHDPALAAPFDADDLAGKAACKKALQEQLGLEVRTDLPLVGVVSRMNEQKGSDMIADAVERLLGLGLQLAVLGSGDPDIERAFAWWSLHGGPNVRAWIGFNEALAHRIEAGADLFLMPSRFEPCGLNQLYSQRYGTLPIVRATGGLVDTVVNHGEPGATGFVFHDATVDAMVGTVAWACDTWRHHPDAFVAMQREGMQKKMGWDVAAERYADVYRWAVDARRG